MRNITFSPSDLEIIREQRFQHRHPHIQQKLEVLWLKSKDLPHTEIARVTGLGRRTIQRYLTDYLAGGLAQIMEIRFGRGPSQLVEFEDLLKKHFTEHPPRSTRHAQEQIQQLTGMKRGLTQVRAFLKKNLKLNYQRVGMIPAGADPTEQRRFLNDELQPVLDEALAGKRDVWFVDGVHLLYAAILGAVWSAIRLFVPAPAGRKRYNILGAVNAVTQQVVWMSSIGMLNQKTVVELMLKLVPTGTDAQTNPLPRPMTLVLDNARYQHARWVKTVAEFLGIQLLYLPAYSPNLNLIERLWKHVRHDLFSCFYYPNFEQFAAAIERSLEEANTVQKDRLKSLLTLKFQMFDNVPNLAA